MGKQNKGLRDKYKSTKTIYPKIDSKSFTIEAIQEISDIAKNEIEDNVIPNETPTGTPETLEYITINGVEYKIENGTLVIANPTLVGTESDLTGIQIGDIKYKIPSATPTPQVQANWNETDTDSPAYIQNKPSLFSGNYNDLTNKPTLWAHYFRLFYTMADGTFVYIMGLIINNSNVDLSFASIRSYLGTLTNNIQRISVSGYCYNSSSQLYESITSLYKYNYDNNSLYFDGERTGTITINDAPSVSDCKVQIL